MKEENIEILVSVIVPAYNADDTLEATLDSLVAQTLEEIEIIVVNDGSSDKTGEIIAKYQRLYPKKVIGIHKINEGVSMARNDGLDIARGIYIGFVDADDTAAPDMFEKMYCYALEMDADLVQCWRFDVTPESKKIRGPHKKCTGSSIYENPEIISEQTLFVWDKIFKRAIIEENQVRFKPFRYAEDILFLFQYELFATNIVELQKPLYFYCVRRAGAVTASFGDALLDAPGALAEMNNLALDSGYYAKFERYLWRVESRLYLRRLNDFWLYDNKSLQEKQAKMYFELLDYYFYGWETTICKIGTEKKIQVRVNAYRSDWKKMLKYIYYPLWFKRICRKSIHLTVQLLKRTDKVKMKFSRLRGWKEINQKIKEKRPAMTYALYRKKPIKQNTVLLTSYYGSSFSDSIYYLAKELLKRDDCTVYIGTNSVKRERNFIHYNHMVPILIDVNSVQYLEMLATAQYLVSNSRFPAFFFKREEQTYLNTWHGTPLKTLGKDIRHGLGDIGNNQTNFLMCDYLLYPNDYTCRNIMNSFFLDRLYTQKVVMCGYPRNAAFFDYEDATIIRKKLKLEDKKVFIYMPTWRGERVASAEVAAYTEELESILDVLDNLLSDNVVVFVKLHQIVMRKIKIKNYRHLYLPHPLYENYRFVNIADGIITDYSSVFFDFANSQKEIILFTYDYERYMDQRGMYFDMDTLPFTRVETVEKLAEHLNEIRPFLPDERYKLFCEEYCKYDSMYTPKYMCNLMLSEVKAKEIQVLDFEKNAVEKWNIYFMSNLKSRQQRAQFEYLADNAKKNDLFVFAQWSFSKETDTVLSRYANSGIQYVVTPGEMPATQWEYVKLFCFRKFSWFRKSALKLYSAELERILPNIKIATIVNLSDDKKFRDICRAVKSKI